MFAGLFWRKSGKVRLWLCGFCVAAFGVLRFWVVWGWFPFVVSLMVAGVFTFFAEYLMRSLERERCQSCYTEHSFRLSLLCTNAFVFKASQLCNAQIEYPLRYAK